jgi:hypothetical protein
LEENIVRAYIRNQEAEDDRYDQMKLEMGPPPSAAHGFVGAFEVLTILSHRLCRWLLTVITQSSFGTRYPVRPVAHHGSPSRSSDARVAQRMLTKKLTKPPKTAQQISQFQSNDLQ